MDYNKHLIHIYGASISHDLWPVALDQVAEAFGSRGVAIYSTNSIGFEFTVTEANSFYMNQEAAMAEYLERFRHYDGFSIPYVNQSAPFRFISDTEIWPDLDPDFGRDDMNFLRDTFGVWRRGGINISRSKGLISVLSMQFPYPETVPSFAASDERLVLSRHLGKALEINRFCSQLKQRYNAVLSMLDHVDVALCVALPTGEIIIQNRRARQIFDEANGLRLTDSNHLRLRDDEQTSATRGYIEECSATAAGKANQIEHAIRVPKRTPGESYLVEISPLRDGDDELDEKLAGALILIIDPQNPPPLSFTALSGIYDITPTETEVIKHLVEGLTVSEIAEFRKVSQDTVKNQTKAAYSKLGVRNRAELIRKITNISPPINTT